MDTQILRSLRDVPATLVLMALLPPPNPVAPCPPSEK